MPYDLTTTGYLKGTGAPLPRSDEKVLWEEVRERREAESSQAAHPRLSQTLPWPKPHLYHHNKIASEIMG